MYSSTRYETSTAIVIVVGSTAVYRPQYTLLGICIVFVLCHHTNSIICTFDMHLICTGISFKLACVPKNMLNRSIEESAAQLDALSRMGMMVCSPGTETPSLARCLYLFSAPPPGLLHFGQGWQYSAAALRAELDALDLARTSWMWQRW